MNLENPRYIRVQGYPVLELELDGKTCRFHTEVKPTLLRHGFISVGFSMPFGVSLPNGTKLSSCTDDPQLVRLVIAFGLSANNGLFQEGPALTEINPIEFQELGERLEMFGMEGSPTWDEIRQRLGVLPP